jgi:accessory gene regulator B
MIEALSERLATKIKQANPEQTASIPVMKFGLTIIFNFLIPIVISLILGAIFGKLLETAFAAFLFSTLRMLSGGYHFTSPIPCMIAMIAIATIPPYLTLTPFWISAFTVCSLALVARLAPSNMRGYYKMPEKYYPLLKILSILLVGSNFFFASSVGALVFLLQAVSLLFQNKEV